MGTRLKQLRKDAGLEIKEVAHRVKKTYQYVRQLEEGPNEPPTWELLAKFAEIYDCSVDEILGVERGSEEKESLPEGGKELLEYLGGMSDRGRNELLVIAKALFEADQRWQKYGMIINALQAIGGYEALEGLEIDDSVAINGITLDGVGLTFDASKGVVYIVPLDQLPQSSASTN